MPKSLTMGWWSPIALARRNSLFQYFFMLVGARERRHEVYAHCRLSVLLLSGAEIGAERAENRVSGRGKVNSAADRRTGCRGAVSGVY